MAQPSVYFSAGRLTMLQRNVLDAAGMERLLSTASLPEARKTLSELGWTGADITDPEQLAVEFYAPLYYWITVSDGSDDREAVAALNGHIDRFFRDNSADDSKKG